MVKDFVIKLNHLKEENVLETIRIRRNNLTGEMYSDIIVRSMFNMLMSVGIRKIERKIIKVKKANFAHDNFDYEVVLLMATTCEVDPLREEWYHDTRCSNHMTRHKE